MLRRSLLCHLPVTATCAPSNFHQSFDVAFYFPRFQPVTHVASMGIPEVIDAVAALQPKDSEPPRAGEAPRPLARWATSVAQLGGVCVTPQQRADRLSRIDKGLVLLERGIDILDNLGGGGAAPGSASVANLLRPLYAMRFELLNGTEHLPRSSYARHIHVQKLILRQSARLLYYNGGWDKSDVALIDTACVILAHFIKAFCALHTRQFNEPPSPSQGTGRPEDAVWSWSLPVGGDSDPDARLTLPLVMERLDECLRLAAEAYRAHGAAHPDLRWLHPKLLLLKALLNIPLTGNLFLSQQHVDAAVQMVAAMTERRNPLLDGLEDRVLEPEAGLFTLAQAELAARMFDWALPPGEADSAVLRRFDDACSFYAAFFDADLDADGIMSAQHAHERRFEAQAYATCLASYANHLLNAPRPPPSTVRDTPVFLPKQLFNDNPFLTVVSPSNTIFADVREKQALPLEACRRRTGHAHERALQINRLVFGKHKENPQAAWILLGMACAFAEARDYLYATGLFESARKAFAANYGSTSIEAALLLKLRYEFLAGVGAGEEATAASHEVVRLLKQLDQFPCR